MARLQILELPVEYHGDDIVTPFVLVVDQVTSGMVEAITSVERTSAELIGARAILSFEETVHIPANAPVPEAADAEVSEADFAKLASVVRSALGIDMTEVGVEPDFAAWLFTACRELEKSEAARQHLRNELKDARMWARHGYEIGQKHCGWTDHGVAPDWLTEGWPRAFGSCEHLAKSADYDTALSRVLELADALETEDAHGGFWDANQEAARRIRAAVGRPRSEELTKP